MSETRQDIRAGEIRINPQGTRVCATSVEGNLVQMSKVDDERWVGGTTVESWREWELEPPSADLAGREVYVTDSISYDNRGGSASGVYSSLEAAKRHFEGAGLPKLIWEKVNYGDNVEVDEWVGSYPPGDKRLTLNFDPQIVRHVIDAPQEES
jgi:hypothetical protein